MRIGELARKLNLNPKTLRYWEEIGLIPKPKRNSSGYRIYSEEHLKICMFIMKAKSIGFSLEEIGEILRISSSGRTPCSCVREKIQKKIEEIDELIKELQKRKNMLEEILREERERERTPAPICPLIELTE